MSTCKAHLVVPVPSGAPKVSGVGSVLRRINALTINIVVSSEAGKAKAGSLVKGVALCAHGGADAVSVEEGPVSTVNAGLISPGLAERVRVRDDASVVVDNADALLDDVPVVTALAGTGLVIPC